MAHRRFGRSSESASPKSDRTVYASFRQLRLQQSQFDLGRIDHGSLFVLTFGFGPETGGLKKQVGGRTKNQSRDACGLLLASCAVAAQQLQTQAWSFPEACDRAAFIEMSILLSKQVLTQKICLTPTESKPTPSNQRACPKPSVKHQKAVACRAYFILGLFHTKLQ